MAFYYVKDDGTATGDAGRYASQQTGSFATLGTSNYYGSVALAIAATTPPVAGDFINASDLHAFSTADSQTYTGLSGVPFLTVAVDDANMDAARTTGNRATETLNVGNRDHIFFGTQFWSGFEMNCTDDFDIRGNVEFIDCRIGVDGSNDRCPYLVVDGSSVIITNTEVFLDESSATMLVSSGCSVIMNGGSVTTTTGGITRLFKEGFIVGGGTAHFSGVDISAVTGTLIADVGATLADDDYIDIRFDMCKIASGVAFTNETFKSQNQRALFTRCSDSSSDAEYQYHLHAFGGDINDDSTIRRAEDPLFEDSGARISYEIVTNSDANPGTPLWFDFPNNSWAALSSGDTDTLRLHLASTSALTNKDIYVELSYPDGTNKQTPNFFSSSNTTVGGSLDLMDAGTTLTTDSGSDWRDGGSALAGHNEYLIDISTSGDAGADTVPIVKVYVTKPSVTIQLGSIFELI